MTDTADDPEISYSESPPENGRSEAAEAMSDQASAPFGFTPFPIDALPDTAAAYVRATSEALDVAPAFVAVPMLPVLAAGVGASARLQLKRSWREPSTLWTTVVAPSGSTKSAALQHVLRPVHRRKREAQAAHQEALARYDPSGNAPRPTQTRYRTGDPTIEAVVRILEDNP
jgi:hypothetical protein